MKTVLHAVFFTFICFAFGSCHYDKYDTLIKPGLPVDTAFVIPATPSYKNHIVPILSANCYSCHSAANKSLGGGFEQDTWSGVHQFCTPSDSTATIISCITWNPYFSSSLYMPNNGKKLSAQNIAIIVRWVFQGAKNN